MHLSLERKIILGFALALAVLLASGGAAWKNSQRLARSLQEVAHTHAILAGLDNCQADALNLQTATRGFLLTGDEAFLEPFRPASVDLPVTLARLRTITADQPEQAARVAALAEAVTHATAIMETLIAAGRTGARAFEPAALAEGKRVMDEIRALVRAAKAAAQAQLALRSARVAADARATAVLTLATTVLATAGFAVCVVLVRRDVRRRLVAERELEGFFNLSIDPLCVVRAADGCFLRVNPAWTRVLGHAPAELLGRPFIGFVHPDDVAATREQAARQAGGREAVAFQNRYRARDGGWRWLEWNASPVTDGVIFGVARDITARKQAEAEIARHVQEVQATHRRLEAANAELEAFSSSVSHDLRAPLRHISGFASLLERHLGDDLDPRGRHYVATIIAAARQMGTLIDDLLAFSRLGRTPLRPVAVDCAALVRDLVASDRLDASPATEWRVGPLPPIRADHALLRQVWINLLDNAGKYSRPRAHPVITIEGRLDPAAGECRYRIADNGVGFDPRYTDKLFRVFSRLHTDAEFPGTGIGLALVHRIITRHGGRVWAEGVPDQGATLHFSLPDRAVATEAAPASPPPQPTLAP